MEAICSDTDSFLTELGALQDTLKVMHIRLEKLNEERDKLRSEENVIDNRLLKLRRTKAESEALLTETLFQIKEYTNTCTTCRDNISLLCEENKALQNRSKSQSSNILTKDSNKKEYAEDELRQSQQRENSLMCVKAHGGNCSNKFNMFHITEVVHSHSALRIKWLEPIVELVQDIAKELFTFNDEQKKLSDANYKQFLLSLSLNERELFNHVEQN